MNKLRTVTIFMAIIGLAFLLVSQFIPIEVEIWEDITTLVAGAFVAFGILADTGSNPQPITRESLIEKLKSPIAIGSLFALLSYIVYLRMAPEQADVILRVVDMILMGALGFGVYNNPNDRNTIRQ